MEVLYSSDNCYFKRASGVFLSCRFAVGGRAVRFEEQGVRFVVLLGHALLCCKLMRLSGARPFGSTSFPVPLFRIKAFGWLCADYSEDHLVGKTTRKRQNRRLGAGRFLERAERHDFDLFQVLMTWGFANRESATCDAGQARGRFRTSLPAPYRQFGRFRPKFSTR